MLFSLNTFFQEDKNLVVNFIQVGGLAQQVILGKEEEMDHVTKILAYYWTILNNSQQS